MPKFFRMDIATMEQPIEEMPALEARAYIMKCIGAGLPACSRCTRCLAPAAEQRQRWVQPDINDGVCGYVADVANYAYFYQPLPPEAEALVSQANTLAEEPGST